jgi:hypothetical protein
LDSRYYIAFIFIIAILPDALIYIMYSEKTFNISSTTRKRFGMTWLQQMTIDEAPRKIKAEEKHRLIKQMLDFNEQDA